MNDHDGISRSDRARAIAKGMARDIVKEAGRGGAREVAHAITDALRDLSWADWVQDLVDLLS